MVTGSDRDGTNKAPPGLGRVYPAAAAAVPANPSSNE